MTQQQLDGAQVRPGLEQVNGERVAKGMRCHGLGQTATLIGELTGISDAVSGNMAPGDDARE